LDLKDRDIKIDIPSYEMLFRRFVKGDWGSNLKLRPKKPFKAVEQMVDFIAATNWHDISLNEEQLKMLVINLLNPYSKPEQRLLLPYTRIRAF
jgi:hypothetical protein